MEFKVGDEVYMPHTPIRALGIDVTGLYPNRRGMVIQIDQYILIDPRGYWFHPSDLSPIYHFEGKRYYWDGEPKRLPKAGEVFLNISGEPKMAPYSFENAQYKILKPITEDKMFNEPVIPIEDFESPKPKYKILKPFTPYDFLMAHPEEHHGCEEFQGDIAFLIGCTSDDTTDGSLWADVPFEYLSPELLTRNNLRIHLLKYGLIAQVEEERTYHVGQRFRIDGLTYFLIPVGLGVVDFITEDHRKIKNNRVSVRRVTEITEKEMGRFGYDFHLIES